MSIEIATETNSLRGRQTEQESDGDIRIESVDQTDRRIEGNETSIAISATSKLAGQTVAPFLAKHIPEQYAPLGGPSLLKAPANKNPNTKYCYRHRPDLKCRRQVDEPSMDQLQRVRTIVMLIECNADGSIYRDLRPYLMLTSKA